MRNLNNILLIALVSLSTYGCGTIGGMARKAFTPSVPPLPPVNGNVDAALSYFVFVGVALVLVGIILLVSPFKHHGSILIMGGAGCAFTGYVIEQYAHYAMIAGVVSSLCYAAFRVGLKMKPKDGGGYDAR